MRYSTESAWTVPSPIQGAAMPCGGGRMGTNPHVAWLSEPLCDAPVLLRGLPTAYVLKALLFREEIDLGDPPHLAHPGRAL